MQGDEKRSQQVGREKSSRAFDGEVKRLEISSSSSAVCLTIRREEIHT